MCKKCMCKHFIQNVSFKCDHINHGNDYKKFSATNFCTALSGANSAINATGLKD
jgi:hypothetical protein